MDFRVEGWISPCKSGEEVEKPHQVIIYRAIEEVGYLLGATVLNGDQRKLLERYKKSTKLIGGPGD
ncbi:MAG: hypothetical protein ACOC80_05885 [Petrotogales bacterium]